MVDFKTSRAIYSDVSLQLAAYGYCDFVGNDDGTESPLVPGVTGPITRGVVVRPKGDGSYERQDFALEKPVFEMFLSCLRVAEAVDAGVVDEAKL